MRSAGQPFTDSVADSIAALGEVKLLRLMRQWLGPAAPQTPFGMGDDCAVLEEDDLRPNLLTVDNLVYGRHFDDDVLPALAGAKLLKRNLSDIAAMGGTPLTAVVACFLPARVKTVWLQKFSEGLAATAHIHGVKLVGGDLTETPGFLGFSLSLLGHSARPLLRSGGRAGDTVWVTGWLGGSRAGHHLTFQPRLEEGRWLASRPEVRALIDVTDGLAKDLPALLPEGLQAELDLTALPIRPVAATHATNGTHPWRAALNDGEDYELCFLVAGDRPSGSFGEAWRAAFPNLPISRLGRLVPARPGEGRLLDAASGQPLPSGSGYEHFHGTH